MSNFSTALPIFLVPLDDEPEEERELACFMRLLASSGLGGILPARDLSGPDGGQPPHDASALLATVLFAFSDAGGCLRGISESCRFDLRYRYLMSGARPGRSTFCRFIKSVVVPNAEAVFAGVTGAILSAMGLRPDGDVFVDGSKFEANANKYGFRFRSERRVADLLSGAGALASANGIPFPDRPRPPYSRLIGEAVSEAGRRLAASGEDPARIERGKGRRLTPGGRLFLALTAYLQRMLAYEEADRICGPGRNSFYRTDHDATAMCLKADYYSGLGSSMHAAYNVQIAVSSGIIIGYYVSQDRADSRTVPALLGRIRSMWGSYPAAVCADAGYGSYENCSFLEGAGISCYVKFPSWEGEVSGKRPPVLSLGADGTVRCLRGLVAEEIPPCQASPAEGLPLLQGGPVQGVRVQEVLHEAHAASEAGREGVRGLAGVPQAEGRGHGEPALAQGDRAPRQQEHPGGGDLRDPEAGHGLRQVQAQGPRRGLGRDDANLPRCQHPQVLRLPQDREDSRFLEGARGALRREAAPDFLRRQERRPQPEEPEKAAEPGR